MQAEQIPIAFDTQGNMLIQGAHSNNYVPGSTGWTINADGSAEFNNIVIRGGTVVSGTALYYAGTPGSGTLIASIAAVAGTDVYGNSYLAGITTYSGPPASTFTNLSGGNTFVGKIVGGVPDTQHAALINAGNTLGRLILNAGTTSLSVNPSMLTMISGNNNVSFPGDPNVPFGLWQSQNGSSVADLLVTGAVRNCDLTGSTVSAQLVIMGTGWAQGSSGTGAWPSLRWLVDAEDNLHIMGTFNVTATGNAVVGTLPAYNGPSGNVAIVGGAARFVGVAGSVLPLYLNNAGQLRTQNAPTLTVGDSFMINSVVPLGNLWE